MVDLVQKLREQAKEEHYAKYCGYDATMRAAADEIELLRELLRNACQSLLPLADVYEDAVIDEEDTSFVKSVRDLRERIRTKLIEGS